MTVLNFYFEEKEFQDPIRKDNNEIINCIVQTPMIGGVLNASFNLSKQKMTAIPWSYKIILSKEIKALRDEFDFELMNGNNKSLKLRTEGKIENFKINLGVPLK